MNHNKELVKNTLLVSIGQIVSKASSFLLLPIYTAFLSPEEYGVVDLILTYLALVAPTTIMRLDLSLFRFMVESRHDKNRMQELFSNTIIVALFAQIVTMILVYSINYLIEIPFVHLVALNVLSSSMFSIAMQFSRGIGHNKQFSISSAIQGVIVLLLNLVLVVFLRMGTSGILLASAIAQIASSTYLLLANKMHQYIKISYRDRLTQATLLKYSLPMIPESMSWWIMSLSDRTFISMFLGISANGIYAASNKIGSIPNIIQSFFTISWSESASIHVNSKNKNNFYSNVANVYFKMMSGLCIMLIAFVPLVFNILIGEQFIESYLYIPPMVLAALLSATMGYYNAIYVANKKTSRLAISTALSAIINLTLCVAFINIIGLWAATISTVISYLVMSIYRHCDTKKYAKIIYEKGLFAKVTGVLGVIFVLYYLNNFWLNILATVVAAVASLWLNYGLIRKVLSGGKGWMVAHRPGKK